MLHILSIGNSFSEDATRYLQEIANSNNNPIFCRNLNIGGCSLQRHADNIRQNAAQYCYQADAKIEMAENISIRSALMREKWDIVTVQQVSQLAGCPESYAPYLQEVLDEIRRCRPDAHIWFHSTWAYEWGSDHPGFRTYQCDQNVMAEAILKTTAEISAAYHLPVIPTCRLIQELRKNAVFDVRKGGISLCRDRFHLSLDYGRYAAGMLWYAVLCGQVPSQPPVLFENADPALLELIRSTVIKILR